MDSTYIIQEKLCQTFLEDMSYTFNVNCHSLCETQGKQL
jgi:hypothetical protein